MRLRRTYDRRSCVGTFPRSKEKGTEDMMDLRFAGTLIRPQTARQRELSDFELRDAAEARREGSLNGEPGFAGENADVFSPLHSCRRHHSGQCRRRVCAKCTRSPSVRIGRHARDSGPSPRQDADDRSAGPEARGPSQHRPARMPSGRSRKSFVFSKPIPRPIGRR